MNDKDPTDKISPQHQRIPRWIKASIPGGEKYSKVKKALGTDIRTVCIEARCPNIGECFCSGTATFLILGDICTRNCGYCAIKSGEPSAIDEKEPERIAQSVKDMELSHVVITSVTRDDIPDGGANHFAQCVSSIRELNSACTIELLIPDFLHSVKNSLNTVIQSRPDILNHNIEVTKNFFTTLRPLGSYTLSLSVLSQIAESGIPAKSGLMIGFGESMYDIQSTLSDLLSSGCSIVTIGQYLRSSKNGFHVTKYYTPDEFDELKKEALKMGFKKVMSAPLVRSSYHAVETII